LPAWEKLSGVEYNFGKKHWGKSFEKVKSFGSATWLRCWRPPVVGCQVIPLLFKRICLCGQR